MQGYKHLLLARNENAGWKNEDGIFFKAAGIFSSTYFLMIITLVMLVRL